MATPETPETPLLPKASTPGATRMRAAHEALAKKRAANAIKRLLEEKARINNLLGEGTLPGKEEEVIIPPTPEPITILPDPPQEEKQEEEGVKEKKDNENEEEKKMSSSEEIDAVPIENKPSKPKKKTKEINRKPSKKRKTPPPTPSNSSSSEDGSDEGRLRKNLQGSNSKSHKGKDKGMSKTKGTRRDQKRRKIEAIPLDYGKDGLPDDASEKAASVAKIANAAMEGVGNVVDRVRNIELPPAVRTAMRDSAATCGWGIVVFAMVLLRGHFEKKYGLRQGNAQQYQQYQYQQPPEPQQQQRANMAPSTYYPPRNNYPQSQAKGYNGGGILGR